LEEKEEFMLVSEIGCHGGCRALENNEIITAVIWKIIK
jgi:hypothetical protein